LAEEAEHDRVYKWLSKLCIPTCKPSGVGHLILLFACAPASDSSFASHQLTPLMMACKYLRQLVFQCVV
jgi:hypothetical protein